MINWGWLKIAQLGPQAVAVTFLQAQGPARVTRSWPRAQGSGLLTQKHHCYYGTEGLPGSAAPLAQPSHTAAMPPLAGSLCFPAGPSSFLGCCSPLVLWHSLHTGGSPFSFSFPVLTEAWASSFLQPFLWHSLQPGGFSFSFSFPVPCLVRHLLLLPRIFQFEPGCVLDVLGECCLITAMTSSAALEPFFLGLSFPSSWNGVSQKGPVFN